MLEHDWTNLADESVKRLLDSLSTCSVPEYRETMFSLGSKLAEALYADLNRSGLLDYDVCVACSVEDADYLARGVMHKLDEQLPRKSLLACFWNQKTFAPEGFESLEIAPILKQYCEPFRPDKCVLVVVKSIVSGACVVATNLNNLITDTKPKKIYVLAPVMLAGSEARLQEHFPSEVVCRFNYIRFAVDRGRDERGWVVPGIGGSVYERYGLGDEREKNLIMPEIVRIRRKMFVAV